MKKEIKIISTETGKIMEEELTKYLNEGYKLIGFSETKNNYSAVLVRDDNAI